MIENRPFVLSLGVQRPLTPEPQLPSYRRSRGAEAGAGGGRPVFLVRPVRRIGLLFEQRGLQRPPPAAPHQGHPVRVLRRLLSGQGHGRQDGQQDRVHPTLDQVRARRLGPQPSQLAAGNK